ncbi:MAG: hypothetical protein JWR50_3979 [Mucilaginibacter sp.]|nr:hypothetical protein [Mucilaginibacter sp.]
MHNILTRNKKPAFYTYRTDSILYTDRAGNKKIVLRQPIGLSADKDNSRYTNIKKDSLVLSDKEVSYVLSELEKMRNYKWSDGLLPDSKVIPIDTITKISKAFREKAWGHFNEMGIYGILTISRPVFLRNDTICLFYFSENCGPDCAGGHFTVYKKVKGYWAQWIELYGWVV